MKYELSAEETQHIEQYRVCFPNFNLLWIGKCKSFLSFKRNL